MKATILMLITFGISVSAFGSFQEVVHKNFPGFKILEKKEFNPTFIKESEPGLVIGNFNGDSFKDFSAMIRSSKKKAYGKGKSAYDYFDGKVVVCHGTKEKSYKCKVISEAPVMIPQESYLALAKPQKTGCYTDGGKKEFVEVKTDAIGWYYPEKGGSHYFMKDDGKYRNCVTSD